MRFKNRVALVSLALAAFAACTKTAAKTDTADAATSAASSAARSAQVPALTPRTLGSDLAADDATGAAPTGEARRVQLARIEDDPLLVPSAPAIRDHFMNDAGAKVAPFDVQIVALDGGRRAYLLARAHGEGGGPPMIVVVDAKGATLWTKENPIAGVVAKVTQLALAKGPMGGIALVLVSAPTRAVAARMWDGEGGIFADFHVLDSDACDALSVLYVPRRGWLVVATQLGIGRAQLLDEHGALAWGKFGVAVGIPSTKPAPSALAADTDASFIFVQLAPGPDHFALHAFATRYDRKGSSLWDAPVDLGPVARTVKNGDRAVATRSREGVVSIVLPGAPKGARPVEITADGDVLRTSP